MDMILGA